MNPTISQYGSVADFYCMVKDVLENGDPEINACRLAYNDLRRTLRGFGKCPCKSGIKSRVSELLRAEYASLLEDAGKLTETGFDERHFSICGMMKNIFSDGYALTLGQAQKWLNMFFKYMYLVDERVNVLLPYLHIPIDNIILDGIEKSNYTDALERYVPKCRPWSKLEDRETYIGFQREFRSLFERPLLHEFRLWNKWRSGDLSKYDDLLIYADYFADPDRPFYRDSRYSEECEKFAEAFGKYAVRDYREVLSRCGITKIEHIYAFDIKDADERQALSILTFVMRAIRFGNDEALAVAARRGTVYSVLTRLGYYSSRPL